MPHDELTYLSASDKLRVFNGCLSVNGQPFVVEVPEGHISMIDKHGNIEMLQQGVYKNYPPEAVGGYYA